MLVYYFTKSWPTKLNSEKKQFIKDIFTANLFSTQLVDVLKSKLSKNVNLNSIEFGHIRLRVKAN